ncbi:MAG TPA: DUF192 domain-containing protein [Patescibacteria group bacterium]|nr:DUF192 domain-containing protein [Patescibacteria group bacterium]
MKEAREIFLMLGAVIVILLVLRFNLLGNFLHTNPLASSTPVATGLTNLKPITINKTNIMVEIANTEALREKGLSGINSLPSDQGMIFDFGTKNITPLNARFWMKGMLIPLDFIWITNNKVVEITPNVPAPAANTPDNQLLIYQPSENIDFVLEVNAGFAMNNLIKVGDNVTGL